MNVTSIGQGPGSAVTLPGPHSSGEIPLSSVRASAPVATAVSARGSGSPDVTVVRLAWFDMNGDGHIDDRSPLAGGDGTLIVPRHASHPEFSRSVTRKFGGRVAAPEHTEPAPEQAKAATPAPV